MMMKKTYCLIFCLILCSLSGISRDRILFNEGWKFKKDDPSEIGKDSLLAYNKIKPWVLPFGNRYLHDGPKFNQPTSPLDGGMYTHLDFVDKDWRILNLPHDWGIEGAFKQDLPGETAKLEWFGVGWYRKQLTIDKSDKEKQIFLDIDGAMSYSTVWCNGVLIGGWPYGYASYRVDLSPYLKEGNNQLAIRLDNPNLSSRWYPGGGIYRNVWLLKTNKIHIDHWGTYVTTPQVSKDEADVNLKVLIVNATQRMSPITVISKIYKQDKLGKPVGKALATSSQNVEVLKNVTIEQNFRLISPELWDIDNPSLYTIETRLEENGLEVDTYHTSLGVRTIEFTANDGFHLNGKRVQLKGVCMHHDHGSLGAAFYTRAMERQIEILQEMGVNAIRTSHNPPAPEMLDLCDRMGILVIDESVDTWVVPKKPNGYSLIFNDWHEQDLRAFIRRDRNHPSVIAWSIGNEVGEQHTEVGQIVSKRLTAIVHEEDPSRPSMIGNDNPNAGYNGFQNTTDVFGYNYKPNQYSKFKQVNTHIPLLGTETASCISTRGEYLFPVEEHKSGGKIGFFMSSYDLYAPDWACPPDTEFEGQEKNLESAGEFVWTGFDYLGEPTPFTADMTVLTNYHDPKEREKAKKLLQEMGKIAVPSRSSYFGIVDLAGFKKDRFYIYQAHWRPDYPMAHILPHWNWEDRKGEITPVHIYTSGDEAELFLNGQSLGRKWKEQYQYRLRWDDVVYSPGELKVVAYKNGKQWAEDVVKTTGMPYAISLDADRKSMLADGYDLIYVTVDVKDKDGLLVPKSNNLIEFKVVGAAEIVGTDNGDQTSHASFQNKYIKAFNGKCLVILRSVKGKTGRVVLKAQSKGLKNAIIALDIVDSVGL